MAIAGYDNIKDHGFDKRSAEEVRKSAAKGGRKSGETRRAKANIKKALLTIAACDVPDQKMHAFLKSMGIEPTMENAMAFGIVQRAIRGDSKAFNAFVRYSGQDETENSKREEAKARAEVYKAQHKTERHEQREDDGLMDALNATAAADWENADEAPEGEDDETGAV